jgi:hypothetical protein
MNRNSSRFFIHSADFYAFGIDKTPQNADKRHSAVGAARFLCGGIAQLVERLHGMQEVSGSTPLTSIFLASSNQIDSFSCLSF